MKITRRELRRMIAEAASWRSVDWAKQFMDADGRWLESSRPTNFKATHRFFLLRIDDPEIAKDFPGYPIRGSLTDPKDLRMLADAIAESWLDLFGNKLHLIVHEDPKETT